MLRTILLGLAALGLTGAAPADWRRPDPENTLVIGTTKGQVVVELRPEFAPQGVARIRQLAREGVYDGLQFHRVIDGFVAQTGNPGHRDGATPFQAVSAAEQALRPDPRIRGWGAYCPGVVGMGRQADPGTANSEIFFMRASARRLDHEYTVVGRTVSGLEAILAVAVGEPPKVPDLMLKVRMMADLPEAERPRLEVMDTRGPAFQARVAALKREKGAAFSICDVEVPSRIR